MAKKKRINGGKESELTREIQAKALPINWNIPDTMISNYANNVLVQILENEFKLLFFETKPQLRINESDPFEKTIRADCFASIIVSPAKIPLIIDVLQRQYEKYEAIQRARIQLEGKSD